MLYHDIYLNRYLFVCRVNQPLVWFPNFPSAEMSLVLGTAIAERLPTVQARPWQKSLASWEAYLRPFGGKLRPPGKKGGHRNPRRRKPRPVSNAPRVKPPDVSWPIEAVLFFYPAKRNYGQGERILWELRLMGESADHGLFLEVILPALEEVGSVSDSRWRYSKGLWGHFDMDAVYIARGSRWEPLVRDGRLDLGYKASPFQWAEGLDFEALRQQRAEKQWPTDCLTWLTPFDLNSDGAPTLRDIADAFADRLGHLIMGRRYNPADFWEYLNEEDRSALLDAAEQVSHIPVLDQDIKSVPATWPGRWIGAQTFAEPIPDAFIPFLGLASVFHIGRHAHFGCGTFVID